MIGFNDSPHAEILDIEGSDAVAFAQAQLASDVRALEDGHWQWSAWLDARGQVRALLQLARVDSQHLVALLRGGSAQSVADALRPYVMRSDVRLDVQAATAWPVATALPLYSLQLDDAGMRFGCGEYSLHATTASCPVDTTEMAMGRLAAIRAGHPWLPVAARDTFLPPALSLERLTAVSFGKGCFPGQEIAARLHYRGGHKKHLYRIGSDMPIEVGTTLRHDDKDVGMVLDSVPADADMHESLAVLQDEIASLPDVVLQWGTHAPVRVHLLQAFGA